MPPLKGYPIMTQSSLKEQLAQLGPVRVVSPAISGSPADVVLRPVSDKRAVKPIDATRALLSGGLTMLKGKRAVEAMLERGEVAIRLLAVSDFAALAQDLRAAGIAMTALSTDEIDVKALREKLGLAQEQFALRYNLSVDTVQHWEAGSRRPDRAANNYLRVIATDPQVAARAQEVVG